jgi:starch-binding outer membrane protein, SusD/RagB family
MIRVIYKTAVVIISFGLMYGCKKNVLDTAPYTSVGSAVMWTTDSYTDLGVAGVYSALRLGINGGSASNRELYQYDRYGYAGVFRDGDAFLSGTATAGNGNVLQVWRELYEGVWRANDAIYNLPLKSPSTEDKKARYVAECKFLRAYFYFRLNQLWKGVPVYLEPTPLEQINRPRETEQKVWDVIVQDLTDAINEPQLPNNHFSGTPKAEFGHATKGAAYALRGKVYLYQGKWAEAVADFQKVKDAGYALFTSGADAYFKLFKEANEKSNEMIFSIQNIGVPNAGSSTTKLCGTRSTFGSDWNNYYVSNDVVDLYENKDGSKFNWDAVIPGYSTMPPAKREVFFLRDNLTAAEISAANARGLDMSLYLPTGNEARILSVYNNRDPRLGFNVITPYSSYKGNVSGIDVTVVMRWPLRGGAASTTPNSDLFTDSKDKVYYLHRKFVPEGGAELINREYGPIDYPVIRYADVLLMWAEALNESGDMAGAIEKVNEVRARAGVALLNSSPATTVTDQADLRERIRNERRKEFVNEGVTYFDELRWHTWKEKVFYSGAGLKQIWGSIQTPYTWQGDFLYAWPIPSGERQKNPSLTQNQGWIE